MKLLIRQGRLVDPVGGIGGVMDVLLEDGRVAMIGSNISEPDAQVIDASGLVVCAGLVDMHVHLREPALSTRRPSRPGRRRRPTGALPPSPACPIPGPPPTARSGLTT